MVSQPGRALRAYDFALLYTIYILGIISQTLNYVHTCDVSTLNVVGIELVLFIGTLH